MEFTHPLGVVTLQSRFAFDETIQRLTLAIDSTDAVLFATIDQQAAAAKAGLALRPTTILIFGNPAAGTRLMEARPIAGLDLPLKILVWEEQGIVNIAYVPVRDFAQTYQLLGEDALIAAMDRFLARLAATVTLETEIKAKDPLV